jgi:DNA-binding transcriptional MerR regulator
MTERLGADQGDAATAALAARPRPAKSADAFRTISEVAEDLNVPQHVLRFWETRFAQLRPLKRAGGRRYYRPENVELLRRIRELLYQNGYTIKGVQKLLRDAPRAGPHEETAAVAHGALPAAPPEDARAEPARPDAMLDAAIRELENIRDGLRALAPTRIAGAE